MVGRPRVYIHTLGCPKNDADSRGLSRRLGAAGVALVSGPEDASHILINTCGFTGEAKEESVGAILAAAQAYPDADVLVMGCLVQRYRQELEEGIPEVAAWFGLAEGERLVATVRGDAAVEGADAGGRGDLRGPDRPVSPAAESLLPGVRSYAYVKISDGCDHRCSFCAIPGIKGPYLPLPLGEVVEQAAAALDEGARELVLVGQDTTIWRDGDLDIADLLDRLSADARVRRIRLMYFQPENVDDRLLDLVAGHPAVVPYLDIPFQHAARRVLRRMSRAGDGQSYLTLLGRARARVPGLSVRSTFIVGFPGETETDFEELLDFVAEARFDHAGAFVYSPEEGTPAFDLRPRVKPVVSRERLGRLSAILLSCSEAAQQAAIGRSVDVMIDEVVASDGPAGTVASGRTPGQAPEVDGLTFIEGDLPPGVGPGDVVRAVITGVLGYDLVARCDAIQSA